MWPEIYQRYCSMKGRNDALACFPKQVKKDINYVKLDLDDDMMAARNQAEAYLVAKANQLLSSGSKADAEEAGQYIIQLKRTNPENAQLLNLRKKRAMYLVDSGELEAFFVFGFFFSLRLGNDADAEHQGGCSQ